MISTTCNVIKSIQGIAKLRRNKLNYCNILFIGKIKNFVVALQSEIFSLDSTSFRNSTSDTQDSSVKVTRSNEMDRNTR